MRERFARALLHPLHAAMRLPGSRRRWGAIRIGIRWSTVASLLWSSFAAVLAGPLVADSDDGTARLDPAARNPHAPKEQVGLGHGLLACAWRAERVAVTTSDDRPGVDVQVDAVAGYACGSCRARPGRGVFIGGLG